MHIVSLASGSSGNSTLISADGTHLLVDCGISAKSAARAIRSFGLSPESIDAILVSHEHIDHIRSVFIFSRKFGVPVYLNMPTYAGCRVRKDSETVRFFSTGSAFRVGNINIEPFPLQHDSADPVGFDIQSGEGKIVCATDLGVTSESVAERIHRAKALILEFNHDVRMLAEGPYPQFLKERIKSEIGHLSNTQAAEFLSGVETPNLDALFLAHLSRKNNLPHLAYDAAIKAVNGKFPDDKIIVTDQFRPTALFL